MLTRMNRKRAVCKMPLAVIERALALEPNQTLTSITNSYDNLRAGEVAAVFQLVENGIFYVLLLLILGIWFVMQMKGIPVLGSIEFF
mgnify:CR=1 FL=1